MNIVCARAGTVNGFDVSSYQPNTDFKALKAKGNEFCFIKASEGSSEDSYFQRHWLAAKEANLLRGAYHFFHPSTPKLQGEFFSKLVGTLGAGDLPCVIDVETMDGYSADSVKSGLLEILSIVETNTGKTPIIYIGPYFAQALQMGEEFTKYPLWVAEYGPKCPLVPKPFPTWTFWQTSGTGMDLNVFNGPMEQLEKF